VKRQKTISEKISFEGFGIHTNTFSKVNLYPSSENTGIKILLKDKLYSINTLVKETNFCTILKNKDIKIMTVEHLFSSLYGLEITNIIIEIEGIEIPAIDGSSKYFTDILKNNVKIQREFLKEMKINENFIFSKEDKIISFFPSDKLEIIYIIDYPNTPIGFQMYKYEHSINNYINNISFCRTFGFFEDAYKLRNLGLTLGSNLDNSLVIKDNKYLNNKRIYNEEVRHKILDLLGDMLFINNYPNVLIIAYRTGHKEHDILTNNIISLYTSSNRYQDSL
jgi:UDP-3-O-[3-hydroxymyristoyl] N-acetylglucosamine deacetylase